MGGFFCLHYLAAGALRQAIDFSWISSPLIDVRASAGPVRRLLARGLGAVWPRFTLETKVRSEQCKRDPELIRETREDPLVHRRITARLGNLLMRGSETLPAAAESIHMAGLKLLMTHGGRDPICPSRLSREFFEKLPVEAKEYLLFEDMLHEPFNDLGREAVHAALGRWIDTVVPAGEQVAGRDREHAAA